MALVEALVRQGFAVEVLLESANPLDRQGDWGTWTVGRGTSQEQSDDAHQAGVVARDKPLTVHIGPSTRPDSPESPESEAFLRRLGDVAERFRPDVLISQGVDPLAREVRRRARSEGLAVAVLLHDCHATDPSAFDDVDAVLVPSRFAAEYYREALGLDCRVLPRLVEPARVDSGQSTPKYLTFVDPTRENGTIAFARIADELGRRRPEIPILVVEGRGTEADVAGCGLDLRTHGNVYFKAPTADPGTYWRLSKACLAPMLWWETQSPAVAEALSRGIPVVASDRGALPETLGDAGPTLGLPDWLTPATRRVPSAEEVAPWVEAVLRLWDDPGWHGDRCTRSANEARRWSPEAVGPEYGRLFSELRPTATRPTALDPPNRRKAVVLVPHLNGVEWETELSLRQLERAGVAVVRRQGSSAIDVARNEMASIALRDGFETLLFIDADIGFDPLDALRLLARPEPVVAGLYVKKGRRDLATRPADGVVEIDFGRAAHGLYPLQYSATGFLRIRARVLRRMIDELKLPLCNSRWGRGSWPFFRPLIVPDGEDQSHYLSEDWAFSHRLACIGVTPMADSSIRLWHYGRYPYGWEDAGSPPDRAPSYRYKIQ